MRILFMGTPDIAAESLAALLDAGHEVCAVFTLSLIHIFWRKFPASVRMPVIRRWSPRPARSSARRPSSVSYTHLDVYKRQGQSGCSSANGPFSLRPVYT